MSIVDATSASAAAAGFGYVRLAHLSPDTPDVDVYLSSVSNASTEQVFPGVGYGVVSGYLRLPVGTYAVAMRAAGAPKTDPPVLTTQVQVRAGGAYTVAGVGRHAELGLKVFTDDLSLPGTGKAKVRVIQASLKEPVLDFTLSSGATIADGVPFATTTSYRQVGAGHWTLRVAPPGGSATTLGVDVAAGNVYSVIVLDGSAGLHAELRTDAGRSGDVPQGAVPTGGGATSPASPVPVIVGGTLIVLLTAGLVTVLLRRRPGRAGRE
jgi:hypothetical protein